MLSRFETIEHHKEHDEMMLEIKRVLKAMWNVDNFNTTKLTYSDKRNYNNEFYFKRVI
jgi:hypothetical protein